MKYKPAKGQKIHQQYFLPQEPVDRVNTETGKLEKRPVVEVRGASARGRQLTTKGIARIAGSKGAWWDDKETSPKGVLD